MFAVSFAGSGLLPFGSSIATMVLESTMQLSWKIEIEQALLRYSYDLWDFGEASGSQHAFN